MMLLPLFCLHLFFPYPHNHQNILSFTYFLLLLLICTRVEIEFPEDSLVETDEETHTKKYSKIIFNGTTYSIGDTIAFWPETKKGTFSSPC